MANVMRFGVHHDTSTCMQMILSNRGIVDAQDLLPGDFVYDAYTGEEITVDDVYKIPIGKFYRAKYTGGRIELYHEKNEIVYSSNKHEHYNSYRWATPEELKSMDISNKRIEMFPITLTGPNLLPVKHGEDPYLLAPFIMYGDFDEYFVNLPIELFKQEIFRQFAEYISIVRKSLYDFGVDGKLVHLYDNEHHKLTWRDLFGTDMFNYLFSSVRENRGISVVSSYIYADTNTRLKFVRGIFDIGYDEKSSLDSFVMIHGDDYDKMKGLVSILASLGIVVKIHYKPYHRYLNKMVHPIEILSGNIPELFYNRDLIERYVNFGKLITIDRKLENLQEVPTTGFGIKVRLDIKHRCCPFLSANMIPIMSY